MPATEKMVSRSSRLYRFALWGNDYKQINDTCGYFFGMIYGLGKILSMMVGICLVLLYVFLCVVSPVVGIFTLMFILVNFAVWAEVEYRFIDKLMKKFTITKKHIALKSN